jgi:DNA mismatch repair protein MutL
VIDAVPIELDDWNGEEVFLQILSQLQKELEETGDFRDSLSKSIACKAAIKAGKRMTKKEMISLINDLFQCEVPYFCPHGRPLIIKITLEEFDKKFRRIL